MAIPGDAAVAIQGVFTDSLVFGGVEDGGLAFINVDDCHSGGDVALAMAHGDTMSRKRIRRVVDTSGGAAVPFPGPPVLYAVDWAFARACRRASNLAGAAAGSALEPVASAADGVEHLAAGASVSMRARRGRTAGRGRGRRAAVADKEGPLSHVRMYRLGIAR